MIRKLNYTGRRKILQSDIDITLYKNGKSHYFDTILNIDHMNLPDKAVIYIEPYYRNSFMRFNCGTAGNFLLPEDTLITEIPYTEVLYFRIKIVNEDERHGRIIAYADKIKPKLEEDKKASKSILPVQFSTDLRDRIWKLSLEDPGPILHINSRIEGNRSLVKSNEFISLVFPAVVNEIFTYIINEYPEEEETSDHWAGTWLKFAKKTLAVYDKPKYEGDSKEELEIWVEDVADSFSRKNKILSKFNKSNLS